MQFCWFENGSWSVTNSWLFWSSSINTSCSSGLHGPISIQLTDLATESNVESGKNRLLRIAICSVCTMCAGKCRPQKPALFYQHILIAHAEVDEEDSASPLYH